MQLKERISSLSYLRGIGRSFLVCVITYVALQLWMDDFGLWGVRNQARVWTLERTSKHLMSYNYVPENFQGVLVGPSYSNNVDPRWITNYKTYNLSLNGANIAELKPLIENVVTSGKMQYLILCLHPFLTKSSRIQTNEIDPDDLWRSVFSTLPLTFYKERVMNYLGKGEPRYAGSDWGHNNYNVDTQVDDFEAYADKKLEQILQRGGDKIHLDSQAIRDLEYIIKLAKSYDVPVFAYYYPVYKPWFNVWQENGEWARYRHVMDRLLGDESIVWDMNTPAYDALTTQASSYSDGHLSESGGRLVAQSIRQKLVTVLPPLLPQH